MSLLSLRTAFVRAVPTTTFFRKPFAYQPKQLHVQRVAMSTFAGTHFLGLQRPLFSSIPLSRVLTQKPKTQVSVQTRFFSSVSGSNHATGESNKLLRFPDKTAIIAYLEQHPLTKDPYLNEKGIIESVAEFFSNDESIDEDGIKTIVPVVLYTSLLNLPEAAQWIIQKNFIAALKDCAQGKPITTS